MILFRPLSSMQVRNPSSYFPKKILFLSVGEGEGQIIPACRLYSTYCPIATRLGQNRGYLCTLHEWVIWNRRDTIIAVRGKILSPMFTKKSHLSPKTNGKPYFGPERETKECTAAASKQVNEQKGLQDGSFSETQSILGECIQEMKCPNNKCHCFYNEKGH